MKFSLPPVIADLIRARNRLRDHFSDSGLSFTLDGNLVGDIGESLAATLFGLTLVPTRSHAAIDGFAQDGRSVQVKATGTGRGPAFRCVETKADHLIFFDLDFENARAEVVFNGPEHYATRVLPQHYSGQRMLTPAQIRRANLEVPEASRLPIRSEP